jgi:hypothetical protein
VAQIISEEPADPQASGSLDLTAQANIGLPVPSRCRSSQQNQSWMPEACLRLLPSTHLQTSSLRLRKASQKRRQASRCRRKKQEPFRLHGKRRPSRDSGIALQRDARTIATSI